MIKYSCPASVHINLDCYYTGTAYLMISYDLMTAEGDTKPIKDIISTHWNIKCDKASSFFKLLLPAIFYLVLALAVAGWLFLPLQPMKISNKKENIWPSNYYWQEPEITLKFCRGSGFDAWKSLIACDTILAVIAVRPKSLLRCKISKLLGTIAKDGTTWKIPGVNFVNRCYQALQAVKKRRY